MDVLVAGLLLVVNLDSSRAERRETGLVLAGFVPEINICGAQPGFIVRVSLASVDCGRVWWREGQERLRETYWLLRKRLFSANDEFWDK